MTGTIKEVISSSGQIVTSTVAVGSMVRPLAILRETGEEPYFASAAARVKVKPGRATDSRSASAGTPKTSV